MSNVEIEAGGRGMVVDHPPIDHEGNPPSVLCWNGSPAAKLVYHNRSASTAHYRVVESEAACEVATLLGDKILMSLAVRFGKCEIEVREPYEAALMRSAGARLYIRGRGLS
ncbi:hypothetical protein GCM10027053_46430 [Intrasporangium mesophilum]